MKKLYWFLLCFSAIFYALPFLFSQHLWWLIFFFPIPLLYITRTENLSFIHGYVWGIITFALHLSGGIYVIACMAGESWLVGVLLGIVMVLYQALSVALIFWFARLIARFFLLQSPIARLCLWTGALALFIIWTDWYSLWIFGIQEGYPLMHPLIPLAQYPQLLSLLPIFGKPLLTVLLLLVPASCVALMWSVESSLLDYSSRARPELVEGYLGALKDTLQQVQGERSESWAQCLLLSLSKHQDERKKRHIVFFVCVAACMPWVLCWYCNAPEVQKPPWLAQVKTISFMCSSNAANPIAMMKIAGNEFKKIIEQHPKTTVIIMPESAFNCSIFWQSPELLRLWSCEYIGKAVHLIFGSFRWHKGNYYNTAHWVYNGELQHCFDKRHATMVSERLSWLIGLPALQDVYFGALPLTAISSNERKQICIPDVVTCVPYICSELFFNEYPDDACTNVTVVALVNDTSFMRCAASYIHHLLLLVARLKAIAWQREIIYVSYTRSLFIDRRGRSTEVNHPTLHPLILPFTLSAT